MVTYPIHVKRTDYRGANPKKRQQAANLNRIADELEQAINRLLSEQKEPIRGYSYYEVAAITGHPLDVVEKLCFCIDGGGSGFTAIRAGLTYEQAIREHEAV